MRQLAVKIVLAAVVFAGGLTFGAVAPERAAAVDEFFTINIGDTVSDGVPAPGAGNIGPGDRDVYEFTTTTVNQQVYLEHHGATDCSGGRWSVSGPSLPAEGRSVCLDLGLLTLPAVGTYSITISDFTFRSVYSFELHDVPPPDMFVIAIGDTVSDGVPGPGAGNIESPGVRDVYTFAGNAGELIYAHAFESNSCRLRWQLLDPSQAEIFDAPLCASPGFLTLPQSGSYTITAYSSSIRAETGPYAFTLFAETYLDVNATDDADDGACDASHCSLREALASSNVTPGAQTIRFRIGIGPQTIAPSSPLPSVNAPVLIDATTQPGYTGTPVIELSGASAAGDGLRVLEAGSNSIVRGLVINGFTGAGLHVGHRAKNVTVENNFIGTDASGTLKVRNGVGVCLCGASDSVVSDNVISGNGTGIEIRPWDTGDSYRPTGNVITGNRIGTDASGTAPLGNDGAGVLSYDTFDNTVGTADPAGRNIISGNGTAGVAVERDPSGSIFATIVVEGNYIGTDVTGSRAIRNAVGVSVLARGSAEIVRNLISGNASDGIVIGNDGGAKISRNKIGTDVSGYRALPNLGNGVTFAPGNAARVDVEYNTISGNRGDGVSGAFANSSLSSVIGAGADQASPLGNAGVGVRYVASPWPYVGWANGTVAYNARGGILVDVRWLAKSEVSYGNPFDNGTFDYRLVNAPSAALSPPTVTDVIKVGEGVYELRGTVCGGCTIALGSYRWQSMYAPPQHILPDGSWKAVVNGAPVLLKVAAKRSGVPTSDFILVRIEDVPLRNCPWTNGVNSDANAVDVSPPLVFDDGTQINSDEFGDACDGDDDNDGLPDNAETSGPPCASASAPTNPLARDSDRDLAADGAECALGTDPADASSRPLAPAGDTDNDGLPDAFEPNIGTEPNDRDTDDDGVSDGIEYIRYNSNPLSANGDGDTCSDGKELASVDANTSVGASDLGLIAGAFGMYGVPVASGSEWRANMDIDKNGVVNAADLGLAASQFGGC